MYVSIHITLKFLFLVPCTDISLTKVRGGCFFWEVLYFLIEAFLMYMYSITIRMPLMFAEGSVYCSTWLCQDKIHCLQTLQKVAAHSSVSSSNQLRVCLVPADVSLPNAEPYVVAAGAWLTPLLAPIFQLPSIEPPPLSSLAGFTGALPGASNAVGTFLGCPFGASVRVTPVLPTGVEASAPGARDLLISAI